MPENEEPEGPNLPPKKRVLVPSVPQKKKVSDPGFLSSEIKEGKHIELKGIIGAATAAMILISYLVYYHYYYYHHVKLNELYFISAGVGISIFTGLLFTFFRSICIKTILLFTSVFYAILEAVYIIVWIIQGKPYAYIKTALIVGLIIGVIYFAYDKFTNKPRNSN